MSARRTKEPAWRLCDDWSIGTDAYNWILYGRASKRWEPIFYHPTPLSPLESLAERLARVNPQEAKIEAHVNTACDAVESRAAAFRLKVDAQLGNATKRTPRFMMKKRRHEPAR